MKKRLSLVIKQITVFYSRRLLPGFSLVELIAAFTLLITISALAIVNFRSYSETQVIKNSALDVALQLQKARSRAQSQVKPSDIVACQTDPLQAYEVKICGVTGSSCTGDNAYELHVICGGVSNLIERKTLITPLKFLAASSPSFRFQVMNGSVNAGSVILDNNGVQKTVQVSGIGNIAVP
jgi:type II secretory pathway pseudopilin PulG